MSHSKIEKRGKSLYLDTWNPSAKRFIVSCVSCGATGFSITVLKSDFGSSLEKEAIKRALERAMQPLPLDAQGRCETCAKLAAT